MYLSARHALILKAVNDELKIMLELLILSTKSTCCRELTFANDEVSISFPHDSFVSILCTSSYAFTFDFSLLSHYALYLPISITLQASEADRQLPFMPFYNVTWILCYEYFYVICYNLLTYKETSIIQVILYFITISEI